jgi:hypothetical protein
VNLTKQRGDAGYRLIAARAVIDPDLLANNHRRVLLRGRVLEQ